MPNVPTQTYTREQWQQIMQGAIHAHDVNAVRDAATALNHYDQESVDATRWSSAPGELQAVGRGLKTGLINIPGGIKSLAGQLGQGDITGAAKSVIGGLGQMGRGIANAVEVGADALNPASDYMPESERLQKLEAGAATLPGLGVARAAEPMVKGAVSKFGGSVLSGTLGKLVNALKGVAPEATEGAAEGAAEAAEQGAAGASPAGAAKGPMTPIEGTSGRGFSAEGPPLKPVSKAMEALSKMQGQGGMASLDEIINRNAEVNKPMDTGTRANSFGGYSSASDVPQFEEGLPAARTSTMPMMAKADIETYLRKIAQASAQGYK